MNGRVYSPDMGRFLSVDPILQAPTSTQSPNPYSYIMNNPLSGTDPTGYCTASRIAATCANTPVSWGGSMEDVQAQNQLATQNLNYVSGAAAHASVSGATPQQVGYVKQLATDIINAGGLSQLAAKLDGGTEKIVTGIENRGADGVLRFNADANQEDVKKSVASFFSKYGPQYDSEDDDYHAYVELTPLCTSGKHSSCSPLNAVEGGQRFPAPGKDGKTSIRTGDVSYALALGVFPLGEVNHLVYKDGTIVNHTIKGWRDYFSGGHLLHDGKVVRAPIMIGKQIFMATFGDGVGPAATLNSALDSTVWTPVDIDVRRYMFYKEEFN